MSSQKSPSEGSGPAWAHDVSDALVGTSGPAAPDAKLPAPGLAWAAAGRPGQRPRAFWLFVCAGAVAVVIYQLMPSGVGRDCAYVLIGLAGALAVLAGVRLYRPARTTPWYLMAAGQLLWVVGDGAGYWQVHVLDGYQFPAVADLLYLIGYPVLAVGIGLLIRGRRPRRDLAGLLDSLTLTVGIGLLSWVVLVGPTVDTSGQSLLAAAVTVAYPAGDIVLLGVMIRLITTPGGRTPSLRLLLTAVALLVGADTAGAALGLLTFVSSEVLNFVWLISYVLWGASALHPSMRTLSEPTAGIETHFSRKRLTALTLAVLVAPTILAVEAVTGRRPDLWAVAAGSVAMFLLVVGRMNVAIREITAADRRRADAQDQLTYQAAHDSLTGLANRAQAMRLISGALSRAQRSGDIVGLLFLDLDGFKAVNDRHGHLAGDEVLRQVSARLEHGVRGGDVVARLGGDEFVVLLEPLDQTSSAVEVAERLVAAVAAEITLHDGRRATVGASIGVAVSQDGILDPDVLLHEADVAGYRAKAGGRGRSEVFDDTLRQELREQGETERALRTAIARDELVLHYQPIIDVPSGTVEGYEALVRWNRPGVGPLAPDAFIPTAERSDLICELGVWVLDHAAAQLAEWNRQAGSTALALAVNISGRHIGQTRICADVAKALVAAGVEAGQLVLEITETAVIDHPAALGNLEALRETGVRVSMDDFGTGYNSIARLESLPVDIIKIDRRFLDPATPSADKLLRLMVQAAHAFHLPVVAEGVEHGYQMQMLRSIGCESAQGFYLGRPVDPSQIQVLSAV